MGKLIKFVFVFISVAAFLLVSSCSGDKDSKIETNSVSKEFEKEKQAVKKRVLYVNSYHSGYEWSDGIEEGICKVFRLNKIKDVFIPKDKECSVELKVVEMDTKRNKSEKFKVAAAVKVKSVIDSWKPDLVIVSDDNAVKYLVEPFLNGIDLPVVFCGVNWSLDNYNLRTDKNITGMIEIAHYKQLLELLHKYTKGTRIGQISGDNPSDTIEVENLKKLTNIQVKRYSVNTFEEWKAVLDKACSEVDILLINNYIGIENWNSKEAQQLILEKVTIPTGSSNGWMADYNLIAFAKNSFEQGEWAAKTALKILDGVSPASIEPVKNTQGKVFLNMRIARRNGVKFSMDLIERAHLVTAEQKRLLYINSYHKGYRWSDDIEKGLLKALNISENQDGSFDTTQSKVMLKVFRMDTKMNPSESFKKQSAISCKTIIEDWKPDVIVTSDDNAAKYLIAPYFKESDIPVVFCGLNWDASRYGFPTSNITGMVEVGPLQETVEMLKLFSKGDRIGVIASDNETSRKEIEHLKNSITVSEHNIKMCNHFSQWKDNYLFLQDSVDMIIWFNPIGIVGWDQRKAVKFIMENTKIPTGSASDNNDLYVLLGNVKIAEEQGVWAGKTALKVLEGISPEDIPLARNKNFRLFINMKLANKLGLKIPVELLNKSTLVGVEDEP